MAMETLTHGLLKLVIKKEVANGYECQSWDFVFLINFFGGIRL